ncbi:MAG: iron-sulfur cluster assembly scaffold protein [Acidobacteria bacterium]|nr:iron-sulfur cluster assembly scaffold protein [Acidobacteriota bacterium]
MHSEKLLEHFQNPRRVGELPPPAATVEVMNPACGDIMRLSVRWENGRAIDAAYKTRGCTASIATGSAAVEWIIGRTREQVLAARAADLEEAVGGLIPESKHAAVLCVDALRAAARLAG